MDVDVLSRELMKTFLGTLLVPVRVTISYHFAVAAEM